VIHSTQTVVYANAFPASTTVLYANQLIPLALDPTFGTALASNITFVTALANNPAFVSALVQNMAVGDLVLSRQVSGGFVLNYDIEQSEDLQTWTTYQAYALPLTNLPTNKAFVRIKAKQ
jgi:hypothetical protein